jgi:hypothetical protein
LVAVSEALADSNQGGVFPMTKTLFLGAGAALALFGASPALAQSTTPEPTALVVKSDWGSVRAPQEGDNDLGVMSLSAYRAQYPDQGDAGFYAIQAENRRSCQETGEWIRESIAIMAEADGLSGEWVTLRQDLVSLGSDLNRAANLRTGTNVISTVLLCLLSAGNYCGAAVSGGVGNEIGSRSHLKQSQLNVRQSDLNARQSQTNLRATLLTMRMNIGWAKQMNWYCLKHHVDATIGTAPAPTAAW